MLPAEGTSSQLWWGRACYSSSTCASHTTSCAWCRHTHSPWLGSVPVKPMSSSTTPLSTGRSTWTHTGTAQLRGWLRRGVGTRSKMGTTRTPAEMRSSSIVPMLLDRQSECADWEPGQLVTCGWSTTTAATASTHEHTSLLCSAAAHLLPVTGQHCVLCKCCLGSCQRCQAGGSTERNAAVEELPARQLCGRLLPC